MPHKKKKIVVKGKAVVHAEGNTIKNVNIPQEELERKINEAMLDAVNRFLWGGAGKNDTIPPKPSGLSHAMPVNTAKDAKQTGAAAKVKPETKKPDTSGWGNSLDGNKLAEVANALAVQWKNSGVIYEEDKPALLHIVDNPTYSDCVTFVTEVFAKAGYLSLFGTDRLAPRTTDMLMRMYFLTKGTQPQNLEEARKALSLDSHVPQPGEIMMWEHHVGIVTEVDSAAGTFRFAQMGNSGTSISGKKPEPKVGSQLKKDKKDYIVVSVDEAAKSYKYVSKGNETPWQGKYEDIAPAPKGKKHKPGETVLYQKHPVTIIEMDEKANTFKFYDEKLKTGFYENPGISYTDADKMKKGIADYSGLSYLKFWGFWKPVAPVKY